MEQDLVGQLMRQVAQATSEKEAAKVELESLKRIVSGHLLRLNSLVTGPDASPDRISAAIQALDTDVRGRLDGEVHHLQQNTSLTADGTLEVLNNDMLRVADANEEVVSTLKAMKGTNKELVEQVRRQSEELSNLTLQRLLDMENMSKLEDAFRHEQTVWQQEAQRCVEAEQRKCAEDCSRVREHSAAHLDRCWQNALAVANKAMTIRAMQSQLKADAQAYAQETVVQMRTMERELLLRITTSAKCWQAEQGRLRDVENSLQLELRAEREVREQEAETWRSRHKTLAAELEELVSRRDREVAELQGRAVELQGKIEAEAEASRRDRQALQENIEALVKNVAMLEARSLQLESHLAQAEVERDRVQQLADTLRQQGRESDEALSEAVRNNEELREQMEVQRLDASAASDKDLKTCREMFEKRLEATAQAYLAEQRDLAKRIKSLEDAIGLKVGELQAMQERLAETSRQRDAAQREVEMWRTQHELAAKMKTDVDREFAQFRQARAIEDLERVTSAEVQRTKAQLAEAEVTLAAARAGAVEREKHLQSDELAKVQRSIAQKTEQLKSLARADEEARRRALRDLSDAKGDRSLQMSALALEDKELERRSPGTAGFGIGGAPGSAGRERDRLDSLARENEQLRRYVSEHRTATSHIEDVGGQMQKTLASMEDRAAELRRELWRP